MPQTAPFAGISVGGVSRPKATSPVPVASNSLAVGARPVTGSYVRGNVMPGSAATVGQGVQAGGGGVAASGGSAPGVAAPQVAPLVNTATQDPNMRDFMGSIKDRIGVMTQREGQVDPNLQTQVDRLGSRMSSDTRQRATDFAAQDINARARASQNALKENLARRGIRSDTGYAMERGGQIDDQARRENARSAAGIALADEGRLDNLTLGGQQIMAAPGQFGLQREQMTNSLLPAQLQGATANASNLLADRNLNLQQYNAANNYNLAAAGQGQAARDAQLANVLAFTRLGMLGNQI